MIGMDPFGPQIDGKIGKALQPFDPPTPMRCGLKDCDLRPCTAQQIPGGDPRHTCADNDHPLSSLRPSKAGSKQGCRQSGEAKCAP